MTRYVFSLILLIFFFYNASSALAQLCNGPVNYPPSSLDESGYVPNDGQEFINPTDGNQYQIGAQSSSSTMTGCYDAMPTSSGTWFQLSPLRFIVVWWVYNSSDTNCLNQQKTPAKRYWREYYATNEGPASGPCSSCSDGLQNGDETGVDCGGSCVACGPPPPPPIPEHCTNNTQDYEEEGIDCGAVCQNSCVSRCPPGTGWICDADNPDFCLCVAWCYPDEYGNCPDGYSPNRISVGGGYFPPAGTLVCVTGMSDPVQAGEGVPDTSIPGAVDVPPGYTGPGGGSVNPMPPDGGNAPGDSAPPGSPGGGTPGEVPGGSDGDPSGNQPGNPGSYTPSSPVAPSGQDENDPGSYNIPSFTAYGDGRSNDVSARFQRFMYDMRSLPVFTFASRAAGNIPTSGVSSMTISCGSWGNHTFDFSDYAPIYSVLSKIFYILTVFACVKIVTKTGAHS